MTNPQPARLQTGSHQNAGYQNAALQNRGAMADPTAADSPAPSPAPSAAPVQSVRSRIGSGLYAHVVDVLGQEIIDGTLPAGAIVFADRLCERLGVSRSVVRESLRTLSSMGLLEARPQVGTRVLPPSRWDLLNPHVVQWRAQGPDYVVQMHQLLELRLGIEQAAAGLAAARMPRGAARGVLEAGLEMRQAFEARDTRAFFEADVTFHRLLLEGTNNPVIAQLADTIAVVLRVRGTDPRPGMHDMTQGAVERHLDLARALVDGDAPRAQAAALGLVEGTLHEFESLLPR
jgi:DNA-binding FadR family transcriptional regulator